MVEAAPPTTQASAAAAREGGEGGDEWAPHVTKMEVGILRGGQCQCGVVKPLHVGQNSPARTQVLKVNGFDSWGLGVSPLDGFVVEG